MVWKNVHCKTCGQDLPEPQARLAMAELEAAEERERELEIERAETARVWRELAETKRRREINRSIRLRGSEHKVDEVWEMRDYCAEETNHYRLKQFEIRCILAGLTVPMKRRRAIPLHHPV